MGHLTSVADAGGDAATFAFAMLAVLFVMVAISSVLRPMLDEAGDRKRVERRKIVDSAKAKSLLASEVALRDEFDEWLTAWELRLKIECAAHPDDQDRPDALAAVELAKRENAGRIVALHQGGDPALAKPHGPESVQRQWDDLSVKCAALRS